MWTAASGTPTSYIVEAGSQPGLINLANSDLGNGAVTLTATGTLQFKYLLDGVTAGFRGSFVAAGQQVTAPSGMPAAKALKITVTTAQASLGANDELSILLPVEGTRTGRLLSGTSLASAQSLGFWFSAHRDLFRRDHEWREDAKLPVLLHGRCRRHPAMGVAVRRRRYFPRHLRHVGQ